MNFSIDRVSRGDCEILSVSRYLGTHELNQSSTFALAGTESLLRNLELTGAHVEEAGFDFLEERIDQMRREVPGSILSRYDLLSRSFADPVVAVSRDHCLGCGQSVPARLMVPLGQSDPLSCCPNCGRFLYRHEPAPDYMSPK